MEKKNWIEFDHNGYLVRIGGICQAKDFQASKTPQEQEGIRELYISLGVDYL